jgi:serpin B
MAAVAAAAIGLAACGEAGGADEPPAGADVGAVDLAGSLSPDAAAAAADGLNAFGFDLHRGVAKPGENTITSPLSAGVLLAMVAAGAGGTTADEMVEVLRLEEPRDTRYAALLADLGRASDVTFSVANSLWAAEGFPFEHDYLGFVEDTYGATLDEVDLGAEDAADAIDDWVVDHTEGRIDGIAEDLELPDPAAVLVLLNAVYFLGTWTTTFDEAATAHAQFGLADGTSVSVPTMRIDDIALETAEGEGFRMARLPYGDDRRFGMQIVLPDEGVALDDLLVDLDAVTWQVDGLTTSTGMHVALPTFELEWASDLTEVLQAMGMPSAFGGGDFTPMSPANPFLDTVVQKTYIRVDEQGTEAAAVTGGVVATSAGPPPFVVDRPFAFAVSDRETGAILFLGTVHDPRT